MSAEPDLSQAWTALGTVKDPCLVAAGFDLSIVDLGLVRGLAVEGGKVEVEMTFTEPGCPFTHHVVVAVETALGAAGFGDVVFRPVWDPVWTEAELTPDARRQFTVARSCMRQSAASAGEGLS
jgi:ring-1,2-phenylacetyl-CoA epoxidase subunit PaaD